MALPPLTASGDLPQGVHPTSLREAISRFDVGSLRRRFVAQRLERIYRIASGTGHLARFIVFGSFVTGKPEPNDVDVFLLMDDNFDVAKLIGEARLLFEYAAAADAHFGASVFWVRRLAALGGEQETIEYWQIKRDGTKRGIVEIISEA